MDTAAPAVARELEALIEPVSTNDLPPASICRKVGGHRLWHTASVYPAVVLTQALEGRLAVPHWEEFTNIIEGLFDEVKSMETGGANASYIPILEEADPSWFGISVCTVDGQRFDIGDVDVDFSIQSCVNPLRYAVAVEDSGLDYVHKHVGIEPSGLAFNEVSLNADGLPHNPMINSGTSLSL